MTKKVLSVVMAMIMLLSCFALTASAYTYAPSMTTGEVVISATADKTTVSPGDVVTITMCIDPGSKTDLSAFGNVIVYNSAQLTPVGTTIQTFRTWLGDCGASFANPNASGNMNYAVSKQLTAFTAEEKAYFDKGIMILGSATSTTLRWNPAPGEGYMSFKMTVADGLAPGTEIFVGTHEAAFKKGTTYFAQNGTRMTNDVYNITNSMVKLTVASSSSSILNPYKSQIRFDTNADKTYAGTFDVRQLAVVSKADFESTFGATTAEQLAAIAEVGFVFARTSTVATFDVETAKALIESGTAAAGYTKKTVDYITTNAVVGADNYGFSCIVEDIPEADKADGLNALAYIKGADGTYHYYPAAEPTSFNKLYTDWYNSAFKA